MVFGGRILLVDRISLLIGPDCDPLPLLYWSFFLPLIRSGESRFFQLLVITSARIAFSLNLFSMTRSTAVYYFLGCYFQVLSILIQTKLENDMEINVLIIHFCLKIKKLRHSVLSTSFFIIIWCGSSHFLKKCILYF